MTVKASNTIKGITLSKSTNKNKKYKATLKDGTVVHFGHSAYEQVKDTNGVGAWSHMNHGDEKRRENYHKRHKCAEENGKKSPNYLSCRYLRA